MNIQKFTQKSVQAIQDCEKLAYEYGNQQNSILQNGLKSPEDRFSSVSS